MATSVGFVPTLIGQTDGEVAKLLPTEDNLEDIPLDPNGATVPDDTPPDYVPRLKKSIVWTYGVGEIGVWTSHVIIGFYLNTFLLEVAGLKAVYV